MQNPSPEKQSTKYWWARSALPLVGAITGLPLAASIAAPVVASVVETLVNNLSEAKQVYEAQTFPDNFEGQRRKLLRDISELQTRTMLEVSEPALVVKVVPPLLELAAEAYKSDAETELESISGRIRMIESWLDRYRDYRQKQNSMRRLAVWFAVAAFLLLFLFAIWTYPASVDTSVSRSVLSYQSNLLKLGGAQIA